MNDGRGLGTANESGHGDIASVGVSDGYLYRAIAIMCVVWILAICIEMIITDYCHAGVYNAGGQALKVVHAVEDTLLDKVIAATELGVRSTATGKTVTGWGVCRFAANAISPLLVIGISAGGVLWSPVVEPWLQSHGWWYEDDGAKMHGTGSYQVVEGSQGVGSMSGSDAWGTDQVILMPTQAAADAAGSAAGGQNYGYTMWRACPATGRNLCWSLTYWGASIYMLRVPTSGDPSTVTFWIYPKSGASVEWVEGPTTPLPDATMKSQFETDFATDGSLAREVGIDLINYLGGLVETANQEWPGTVPEAGGYAPLSDAQGATVQTAMNDAIDAQAKADLQESADENGTMAPAGTNQGPANVDWEYTPEQHAAAQKVKDLEIEAGYMTDWAADKPDDGDGGNVTAGTYTLPERKDLSGVLDTFKGALNNLPIISWASGVNLQVSGASSIVNLPIPAAWGGSIEVDFADYESVLDAMGAGLYAIVGMAGVLFLFRGRGD